MRASVDVGSVVAPKARPGIAPSTLQGLEVLSLSAADLDSYIRRQVERNPMLDYDYDNSSLDFQAIPAADAFDGDADYSDRNGYLPSRCMKGIGRDEIDFSRFDAGNEENDSLQAALHFQASRLVFESEKMRQLCNAIIEAIDEDGYYSDSLSVLCYNNNCSITEGEKALEIVQGFQPRGVGARNLGECLLLQMEKESPYYEVFSRIVKDSFSDFAFNRLTRLSRDQGISRGQLLHLRSIVQTFNPRPGDEYSHNIQTVYIVPDLVVKKVGSSFVVDVTGELTETVMMNAEYAHMACDERTDAETLTWLSQKSVEASSVLHNVERRKQTLYKLGRYLLDSQYDFFKFGESRLRPLTMQDAADSLSVHTSTISRAVQDKYMLTPWGIYPLKFFFCGALRCGEADMQVPTSTYVIKKRLQEIVANENVSAPLSDASLTNALNREGVMIKRRTVTKYRESLGIARQSQRRGCEVPQLS